MLMRLIDWLLGCALENPARQSWDAIAKAAVCYLARLATFAAILYLLARFGLSVVNAL